MLFKHHSRSKSGILAVRNQYPDAASEVRSLIGELDNKIHAKFDSYKSKFVEHDEAIDDLNKRFMLENLNGGSSRRTNASKRELSPLMSYMRKGHIGETRAAMTGEVAPEGGFLVPQTIDNVIQNQLVSLSPLRGYASIVTLGRGQGVYSFNVNRRGASSGWAGETTARAETKTPGLANITPAEGELFANPKVSQMLLDDSSFDVESFVQENISDEFAVQEGAAFVAGDGIVKPMGFLSYQKAAAADAARAFGTLQFSVTGAANGFATDDPADCLINLIYSLRAPYRAGPGVAWLMNSKTASIIRQFKDAQGRYVWSEALVAGQPSVLLGYPVAIDENMPDVAANSFAIAFGNWKLGYRIVDRLGVRMLRDPYSQKPFVFFYTTKRVGGCVADSNAIKLLKCST